MICGGLGGAGGSGGCRAGPSPAAGAFGLPTGDGDGTMSPAGAARAGAGCRTTAGITRSGSPAARVAAASSVTGGGWRFGAAGRGRALADAAASFRRTGGAVDVTGVVGSGSGGPSIRVWALAVTSGGSAVCIDAGIGRTIGGRAPTVVV